MEFPPGFYFYLSFAFSFFLPSVIHLFTHPSSYYYYCSSSNSSIYFTLTVLFFHIPQMDFKSLYRYMYFPDGYAERSNK